MCVSYGLSARTEMSYAEVTTIAGASSIVEGTGSASLLLPNGTILRIKDAIYSSKSNQNLLSLKDIHANGYHIETLTKDDRFILCIMVTVDGQKLVLEQCPECSSGLYSNTIRLVETYAVTNFSPLREKLFDLWHDRLGHPGLGMMRKIINNVMGLLIGEISNRV